MGMMQGPCSPAAAGSSANFHLVLGSWEYFFYCFCLWPLSEKGDLALDAPAETATGTLVKGVAGNLGLGGGASEKPLYLRLLKGYLDHFLPHSAAFDASGEVFVEAIAQFWLSQNPTPAASLVLTGATFQPTSVALLNCLEVAVLHLNANEVARTASPMQNAPSSHTLLQTSFYHFYLAQLRELPDISARVARLIRIFVLYLQPWAPPSESKNPPPASPISCGGASQVAPPGPQQEAWEWAPFVQRNFFLYVRLLTSVARELCSSRFRMTEKRDVSMLRASAALFDTPGLLPLLRSMSQAAEQLLDDSLAHGSPARQLLCEQLERMEGESGWRAACEAATPAHIYQVLDKMDDKLRALGDEHRQRHPTSALGFEGTQALSPVQQTIETLRRSTQHALRELLPKGASPSKGATAAM